MKPCIFLLILFLTSCHKVPEKSHLISLQMVDRNGQSETISQAERIKILEKQDFAKPQPYEKILRVYSKNETGKNPSILTTYHKNGQLFQTLEALDGRAFGQYHEYYETGQLRIASKVIEGTADLTPLAQASWVFDGDCTVYYPHGKTQAQFHYDRGQRSGPATYFYETGALQKKITFEHDLACGLIEEYYEHGPLSHTYEFINGEQHGFCQKFYPNHEIAYTETWDHDHLQSGAYFDPQGQLISLIQDGHGVKTLYEHNTLFTTVEHHEGHIEGKVELFDTKGLLSQFYHILNSQKQGEEAFFYEGTNNYKMSLEWDQDALCGLVKTFYKNGTLESQKSYYLNKKNGPSSIFYQNGDLMMLETYSQDKLVEGKYYKKGEKIPFSVVEDGTGKATFFDLWGAIKQEIVYEKGKALMNDDS
jgi:antitoxin component YwqK of YwqJK toxin-antitoxin module